MLPSWVSTILLWSTSALSPLRPPESVPLVPASALSPALSCGSALELSVLRALLIAFSVVVLVCENWSMVLCALVAAVFVESLSWVSAASVAAAFWFSRVRSSTICLMSSLNGLSGRFLRSSMSCATSLLTLVMLLSAVPAAPLAVRMPFVMRVASVVAWPLACRNRLLPLSSWSEALAVKLLRPDWVFVSRPEAVASPVPAVLAAAVTSSSALLAASVFSFVPASVVRRSAIIVRVLPRLSLVLLICASACCTELSACLLIDVLVVLTMSLITLLAVETKVLLTWRSTVVAPTPVILGATAFAFSLT